MGAIASQLKKIGQAKFLSAKNSAPAILVMFVKRVCIKSNPF